MKVVVINSHLDDYVGGSQIQCNLIARGLASRGSEVVYIAVRAKKERYVGYDYKIIPLGIEKEKFLPDLILGECPSIVYWRFNKKSFYRTVRAINRAEVPFVFAVSHINDLLPWAVKPGNSGIRSWISQLCRRLQARWGHAGLRYVQAVTTNNRDLMPLSPVANTYYVPNGMCEGVEPFHWPRPYVAWVANIKPAKRPELFVEATRALAEHDIDGLMVGQIQADGYDWLTDRERTPSNFHYLGPRTPTEVNGLLAGSRLHVHTCQPEGFPNVFIQAWMQGRPSVSLEFDPSGYIEEQGLGAVSTGDVNTFIKHVVDWATHPERSDEVGRRAQVFARDTFSVDTMVERVEVILASVVSAELNNRDR